MGFMMNGTKKNVYHLIYKNSDSKGGANSNLKKTNFKTIIDLGVNAV
jgi:hypothetical protein